MYGCINTRVDVSSNRYVGLHLILSQTGCRRSILISTAINTVYVRVLLLIARIGVQGEQHSGLFKNRHSINIACLNVLRKAYETI